MAGVSIFHWILQNEAFTRSSGAQSGPHMVGVLGLCFCFEVQIRERLSYQSADTHCTRRCRPAMRYDRCFLDKRSLEEKALHRAEREERREMEIETNVDKWKKQTTAAFKCFSDSTVWIYTDSLHVYYMAKGRKRLRLTAVRFCFWTGMHRISSCVWRVAASSDGFEIILVENWSFYWKPKSQKGSFWLLRLRLQFDIDVPLVYC